MSTTALLERLEPWLPGWSRETGNKSILKLVEQARDELVRPCLRYLTFIDYENNKGFPPYLTTVDGTYRYEITAANLTNISTLTRVVDGTSLTVRARKVNGIFVDVSSSGGYGRRWVGEAAVWWARNPFSTATDRLEVARVPAEGYPATENGAASVVFPENPGSTTEQYFVDFLWEFPRLLSSSIPIGIPERFEEALECYCIGRAQTMASGKMSEFSATFTKYWKREFRQEVEGGVSSTQLNTPPLFPQ